MEYLKSYVNKFTSALSTKDVNSILNYFVFHNSIIDELTLKINNNSENYEHVGEKRYKVKIIGSVGIVTLNSLPIYKMGSIFENTLKSVLETIISSDKYLELIFRNRELEDLELLKDNNEEKIMYEFYEFTDGGNDKLSQLNILLLIALFYLFFVKRYLINYTIKHINKVVLVIMLTTFRHTVF